MNQNSRIPTPICDFIQGYTASGMSRFHMPGHKGSNVIPQMSAQEDITEVSGADSLYEANGIILKSESIAAELFGTGATFYSTEGSSHCIRTMLALVTRYVPNAFPHCAAENGPIVRDTFTVPERPVILAARNVHRSFLTAAALLDLDIEWLYPDSGLASPSSLCSCPVSANQIRHKLDQMEKKPAAVYLTSPDYLGYLQDIASIAEVVHKYEIPLLVDNAHGAYLHFLEKPLHPVDLGADLCCDSAHKTLPALTGCAYLHISKQASSRYAAYTRKALSLFGSTSPSYLLLASLDRTNAILGGDFREQLSSCVSAVRDITASLPHQSHITVFSEEYNWNETEPLKITIAAPSSFQTRTAGFLTGIQLADILRSHMIECEYADLDHVVLMVSPCNTPEDLMRLKTALQNVCLQTTWPQAVNALPAGFHIQPSKVMSIREAALAPARTIPVTQAAGHVCADLSLACPPGIPIVVCGEMISSDVIKILEHYGLQEIDVL